MKKLFVLLNHKLDEAQKEDAKISLNITEIVILTTEIWSKIPPESDSIDSYLSELKTRLKSEAKNGDYLLVQGDFGATYLMIQFALSLGVIPIYATTTRSEMQNMMTFKHHRFREYGK